MQRFSRFCTMLTNGFRGPSGKGGYNGFTSESSKTRSTISEQPRDKQRLILVVDGADLMRLEDGTESLRWLPTKLPKRVSVILSLSLPAPLEERRSNSQKIEVSKSLLKFGNEVSKFILLERIVIFILTHLALEVFLLL